MRKIDYKACVNRIMQILLVALSAFLLDYLIVQLADDESIWLGVSVEIVGSVLFSPVVGAAATLINCLAVDYLMYGITNYSFINILEMASVALIGIVYRRLCKDDNALYRTAADTFVLADKGSVFQLFSCDSVHNKLCRGVL